VFVALLFWLFCNKRFKVSAALLALIPCLLYLAYWVALVDPDSPNHGIAEWVSENSLTVDFWVELLKRAGNRYPRFEAALEMVEGHWWLGLGPGGYAALTKGMNFDHISGGVAYFDPAGLPVINVLLEAVTNAGIFSALVLVACFAYLVSCVARVQDDLQRWTMMGALFAIGLMLQFESSYLRAYVWFAAGVFVSQSRGKPNASVICAGER
jgi:O-antigen ligase